MKLETKVLDYINRHQEGVKISEMETPLGETRMKLGFVTKNLFEARKIMKIDHTYYPKPGLKEAEPMDFPDQSQT